MDMAPMLSIDLNHQGSLDRVASIKLWPPVNQGKSAWYCENYLEGVLKEAKTKTFGEDPIQAIILSIQRMRLVLDSHPNDYFVGESPISEVLPKFVPIGYGEKFQLELEQIIEEAISKKEKELTERFSKKYPNYPNAE